MTKKEYILKILETLKDDWPVAKWLAIVILELEDEKLLEAMYKIFNKSINNIKDKNLKKKFSETVSAMKEMRLTEKKDREHDFEELEDLEKTLNLL